jgi:hypothetical protein
MAAPMFGVAQIAVGALRARGASPRPGTSFPFPFGLPTAPHPSRARLRYNQIVGGPFPIFAGAVALAPDRPSGATGLRGSGPLPSYSKNSKDWNPSAGASGALARRGALCIRGGRGRIPPLSKHGFLTIQRKFFRPLFLPISLGQIVPLSKLSPA